MNCFRVPNSHVHISHTAPAARTSTEQSHAISEIPIESIFIWRTEVPHRFVDGVNSRACPTSISKLRRKCISHCEIRISILRHNCSFLVRRTALALPAPTLHFTAKIFAFFRSFWLSFVCNGKFNNSIGQLIIAEKQLRKTMHKLHICLRVRRWQQRINLFEKVNFQKNKARELEMPCNQFRQSI